MSGTLPTSPTAADADVASNAPTLVEKSASGRRSVRQLATQHWQIKISYPPMTRAEFAPINAFINSQRGRFESFDMALPPPLNDPQGTIAGSTPLINGASQTGRSVITDGWAISTLVLKAGDFVQFSGHTKVYQITADITSDGSGNATLSIEPALVESPAENEALVVEDIPFRVGLVNDVQAFQVGSPAIFRYVLDVEEIIE
jgi:hypothetical protein